VRTWFLGRGSWLPGVESACRTRWLGGERWRIDGLWRFWKSSRRPRLCSYVLPRGEGGRLLRRSVGRLRTGRRGWLSDRSATIALAPWKIGTSTGKRDLAVSLQDLDPG
jgi:hypothetical protein